MSTEEMLAKVATAREEALAARGGTEKLLVAEVELGTITECVPFLDGAAQGYAFASEAYAAGDTATGDLYWSFGATWSAIAALCLQAAHPPTPV